MLLVVDRYTLLKYDRGDFAVFREHFLRAPSVHDGNAFFFHLCDLVLGRGHFAAGLQAEHCDFAVCHAKRCAGYVRRDITAANYDDVAAKLHGRILVHLAQEIDACDDAFRILAGDTCKSAALQADRDIEGLEAAGAEIVERDVFADVDAAFYPGAHLLNDLYFGFHNILLQAEGRDSVHEHAAGASRARRQLRDSPLCAGNKPRKDLRDLHR